MLYANVDGERRPASPGVTGACPLCKSAVKAYCGEFYVWHWKHVDTSQCDSWYEPETEWHKSWKNRFPPSWQEVSMTDQATGERHIADVKTQNGTVIEFQNSNISPNEIRSRESFYGEMIWVVNAEKFKDRFQIHSKVTTQLRELEWEEANECQRLETIVSQYEANASRKLNELQSEVDNLRRSKIQLESRLAKICAIGTQEIEKLASNVLGQITSSAYELNEYNYELKKAVPTRLKDQLNQLKGKIQSACVEIEKTNRKIEEIETLPESDIVPGYKLVHHRWINEANFTRAKIVDLKSKETLYPDVRCISDYADLRYRKLIEGKYEFVLNLKEDLAQLKITASGLERSQELLQQQFLESADEIKRLAYGWHAVETEKLRKQVKDKEAEVSQKEEEFQLQGENLIGSKKLLLAEKDNALHQLSRSYREKKSRVMVENKGLYFLQWKHERKIWREAKCPVYFDVGEWLFVHHSGLLFRKVEIEVLVNQLLH